MGVPVRGCSARCLGDVFTSSPAPGQRTHRLSCGILQSKSSGQNLCSGVCLSGDVKTVSTKAKAASAGG